MTRLSDAALPGLPAVVERPAFDRASLGHGIVHLGLGAFHRAHQAIYTEDAVAAGDRRWGTVGVSLRSPDTRDALAPQDGLYALAIRSGEGEAIRVVGNIRQSLVAPENPQAVLDALLNAETRIASLTITEKGYCHRPATGELDEDHPDIRHDLANRQAPRTALGFLAEAAQRRRIAGLTPLTLLTCDNLSANGETLARVFRRFCALRDPDLGAYVADAVACPSTMVDRIVPATAEADRDHVARVLGVRDVWPVMTEPFTQWVIEDRFPNGRPDWGAFGATFVADVAPFELMKLRLLNGSHSTLSYLGYLAGHETVADTMAAPGFADLVRGLMREEAAPTLPPLAGFDLARYQAELVARFRNAGLRHRTWQIAMDGSQKVPQRLLGTIRDRLAAGRPFERLALGLAAWMIYATGRDETNNAIDVRDPLSGTIAALTAGRTAPADLLDAYLGLAEVFGTDLPASEPFRRAVLGALETLRTDGAARTVAAFAHR